jgi:hypothetical protein
MLRRTHTYVAPQSQERIRIAECASPKSDLRHMAVIALSIPRSMMTIVRTRQSEVAGVAMRHARLSD